MDSVNSSVADISNVSIGDMNESNNLNNANSYFNPNTTHTHKKKRHHNEHNSQVKEGSSPNNRKKHHKHIQQSYQRYIRKVFGLTHHTDLTISEKAKANMNSFMNDLFDRVLDETTTLSRRQNRNTISEREMDAAAKLILHGDSELYINCHDLFKSALNAYKDFENNINTTELDSTNLSQINDSLDESKKKKDDSQFGGGLDDLSNISTIENENEDKNDLDAEIEKDIMGEPGSSDSDEDENEKGITSDTEEDEDEEDEKNKISSKSNMSKKDKDINNGMKNDIKVLNTKEVKKLEEIEKNTKKRGVKSKK